MNKSHSDLRRELQEWIDEVRDGELAEGRSTAKERRAKARQEAEKKIAAAAINNRSPWTEEEDEVIVVPELTAMDAAELLGRTVSAVNNRRRILRLGGGLA